MSQTLRALPVGMFGAVMGIAGLGLALRPAVALFRLPSWVSEFWVFAAAAALALLLAGYVLKLLRHADAVVEDFANPASLGFCAALPVGMTLVAGGLQPYALGPARALWFAGAALLVLMQVFALARWLRGGLELGQVNGGWMILFVGGLVLPSSGLPLGFTQPSAWFFGISTVAAPFVMGAVLFRTLFGPALPAGLRPSTFILLVPSALIFANGLALGLTRSPLIDGLFFVSLPLAAALLLSARNFLSWPFGASWWAFTFPLDALAVAAVRFAQLQPTPAARVLAAATLILATLIVALVLVRTLLAFLGGTLFVPPAPPPAKP